MDIFLPTKSYNSSVPITNRNNCYRKKTGEGKHALEPVHDEAHDKAYDEAHDEAHDEVHDEAHDEVHDEAHDEARAILEPPVKILP